MGRMVHNLTVAIVGIGPANTASAIVRKTINNIATRSLSISLMKHQHPRTHCTCIHPRNRSTTQQYLPCTCTLLQEASLHCLLIITHTHILSLSHTCTHVCAHTQTHTCTHTPETGLTPSILKQDPNTQTVKKRMLILIRQFNTCANFWGMPPSLGLEKGAACLCASKS